MILRTDLLGLGLLVALTAQAAIAAPPEKVQGLTDAEREQFYHLAEGSELYPLAWLRALESSTTHRPFLDDLQRFGFLDDPMNPDGLPVGITAHESRDVTFLGRMVGINCAACHVGALTVNGKTIRLHGGQALIDLAAFYGDMFQSAEDTFKDRPKLTAFLERLAKQGEGALDEKSKRLIAVLAALGRTGTDDLEASAKEFQDRLRALLGRVRAEAGSGLGAGAAGRDLKALRARVEGRFRDDIGGLVERLRAVRAEAGPLKDLKALGGDARAGIEDLVLNMVLLKQRLDFLQMLGRVHHDPRAVVQGPGRSDAFDIIRDVVFTQPADYLPANAPVNYPHLWQLNQTTWLHWDGNTNSLMERNVGQSIGLGAVFDPKTYSSTVLPQDLHELEVLVRKITPPTWDESILGPIDRARAERGRTLYAQHCGGCHARPDEPDVAKRERFFRYDKVGTDPIRAENFAVPVNRDPNGQGGTDFAQALSREAKALRDAAYRDNQISPADQKAWDLPADEVRWQTTRSYVARPLVAIWATAPYLHNGSIPTLYDLMRPAAERPATFAVGHHEYDPVKLGYVTDPTRIPPDQRRLDFKLDTTIAGNRNTGHEYGTRLAEEERLAILEYIKTQ
jgi:hypothetical protein